MKHVSFTPSGVCSINIEYDIDDEEEELRCWYVAMTRAEDNLIISIPEFTVVNGLPLFNNVLHFINGLDQYFIRS